MDPVPKQDPVNDRTGHVVAVWREMTLLWGGQSIQRQIWDPAIIHCHQDGIWLARTTSGHIPPPSVCAAAEVVDNHFYVFCGYSNGRHSNNIYQLDLNTWVWLKLDPKGSRPLKSSLMVSWVCGEKIYLFGGIGREKVEGTWYPESLELVYSAYFVSHLNNQLLYYDCHDNSWNWPTVYGIAPTPRIGHAAFSVKGSYKESESLVTRSRSLAFVFGGYNGVERERLNDIFFLDMDTMKWEYVSPANGLVNSEKWPKYRSRHSLTMVSPKAAVLFGGTAGVMFNDCWLLNIDECISKSGTKDIWTRYEFRQYDLLEFHKAILEPSSRRVWMLGGTSYISNPKCTDNIRELTITVPPLKTLALESAAKNLEKLAPELLDLPKTLQRSVEAKASRKYVIS